MCSLLKVVPGTLTQSSFAFAVKAIINNIRNTKYEEALINFMENQI